MIDGTNLDEVARAQHGLLTTQQAVDLLGRSRKERWASQGLLTRVQPQVWRTAGAPATWHQALAAAHLSSDGVISHRAASAIWGLTAHTRWVEAAVRSPRRPRLWAPAIVHTVVDLDGLDTVWRDGLPVTGPTRTLIDLGLVLRPEEVESAFYRGVRSGLFGMSDVLDLRRRLSKCGRNGVGIVGALLERLPPEAGRAESALETRFLRLLTEAAIPPPVVQHEVWDRGRLVARIDAAYPELRIAIELDGFEWHSGHDAFQRDRSRQNALVALGWTVLRFTWSDVVDRGAAVVEAILRARTIAGRPDSECA